MTDSILDKIRETTPALPKVKGKIWLMVLLEYDFSGNAKVITSYTKPHRDSNVKKDKKETKVIPKITKEEDSETTSLF